MDITYTLMLGDDEIDVDFQIDADMTYAPARGMGGPWENSSPDESECDITEIKVLSDLPFSDAVILDALETQVGEDKITEDLWEDYMDRRNNRE
jgi:hypothetical protein